MRILVDADACPVKDVVKRIAYQKNLEVIFFIDNAHELKEEDFLVIKTAVGKDSVDLAILKNLLKEDIVITQDFGLAALVLTKGGRAINQNGLIFTNNNIEQLLFERFANSENRRANKKTKNMSKRKKENDLKFEKQLLSMF